MSSYQFNFFSFMTKKLFLIPAAVLFGGVSYAQQVNLKKATDFAKSITAADLKTHLTIVAADDMMGRETATEGQRKAAAYLQGQMQQLGLKPGNNGVYQQPYPVYRDEVKTASVTINGQALALGKDFTVTTSNHPANIKTGEVVFINFEDSLWKQDKINVAGRVVMFYFQGMNQQQRGRQFGNTLFSRMNSLVGKGIAAAIVVQDIFPSKQHEDLGQMTTNAYPTRVMPNSFVMSPTAAAGILGDKAAAAAAGTLTSGPVQANIDLVYDEVASAMESSNILGVLEGSDLKDEWLVISAHYDHVGTNNGVVFNGADDDGSGTVSVLEIAEAFVKAKAAGKGPRRSILFLLVSGEEKGLWGSHYYSENPVFPLDKTTADLNIDMIGRVDSLYDKTPVRDYVYVVGDDKLSSDLTPITAAANKMVGLKLDPMYNDPNDRQRIYYRSDHYNFARKGVPIIFYFDGLHKDYHRPTDDVENIEFDVMEKRARLVFYTAWEMANRDAMIKRDIPLPQNGMMR